MNEIIADMDKNRLNLNRRGIHEYIRSDYVEKKLPSELRNVVYLSGRQLDEMIKASEAAYSYPNDDLKHQYDANLGWEIREVKIEAPDYSKDGNEWARYDVRLIFRKNNSGEYSHGLAAIIKKGPASYGASQSDPAIIKVAEPSFSSLLYAQNGGKVNFFQRIASVKDLGGGIKMHDI